MLSVCAGDVNAPYLFRAIYIKEKPLLASKM